MFYSFFFFNFLSNSKTLIFFPHFSVRPTKLKLDTHMGNGLIYGAHQIQAARLYLFLYFSVSPKNLHLENCGNIPLMALAGGM